MWIPRLWMIAPEAGDGLQDMFFCCLKSSHWKGASLPSSSCLLTFLHHSTIQIFHDFSWICLFLIHLPGATSHVRKWQNKLMQVMYITSTLKKSPWHISPIKVTASSAEVASSSNSSAGFRHSARAMHSRCACPPLRVTPSAPPSMVSLAAIRKTVMHPFQTCWFFRYYGHKRQILIYIYIVIDMYIIYKDIYRYIIFINIHNMIWKYG